MSKYDRHFNRLVENNILVIVIVSGTMGLIWCIIWIVPCSTLPVGDYTYNRVRRPSFLPEIAATGDPLDKPEPAPTHDSNTAVARSCKTLWYSQHQNHSLCDGVQRLSTVCCFPENVCSPNCTSTTS